MEELMSHVNKYCERTDFSFWSEPINFLTNAAFILVALWLWLLAKRRHAASNPALRILILLVFLVGVGSGLFHSLATRWAEWCDIIPISLFVMLFLGVWLRQGLGRSTSSIALAYGAFFALHASCIYVFRSGPLRVGGSEPYFAVAIFLLALGRQQQLRTPARTPYLMYAAVTFIVAMVLRSIDRTVCDMFPLGTHAFWHVGCALVCAFLVTGLIESKVPASD